MSSDKFYLFSRYFSLKLLFLAIFISGAFAQKDINRPILILEIKSEIDPQMNRYVKLALERAKEIKARAIVIEMNTYGGALKDADDIRTTLLEFPEPVIVFINKNAASAGALISIACDSIYMAPGANIGAATVVTGDGTPAPGKYQSYMRSIMRSTAEANGRNPKLAEAMVDEDLAKDSLNQAGKVLTLTTEEAIKYGYCEKKATSLKEALKWAKLNSYPQEKFELSAIDEVVAFFLNPFVSGILILVIIGGIYFELQQPGIGLPIIASLMALALYFIPYYLNGLAENWEILLFFIGVILLAVEIFVIPGFGVAGVTGLVLMLGSLALAMLDNKIFDFSFVQSEDITRSILTMLSGLAGGIILIVFGGWQLTKTQFFKRVSLPDVQDRKLGYTSSFKTESMIGKIGKTFTVLRPSGKIIIGEDIYDAYSRGEYIEKDVEIIVVSNEGTSLRVKRTEQ